MLTQKFSLVFTGLAALALASGCTIKSVDTSNTSESTTNGVTSTNGSGGSDSSSTTGEGGAGGSGGDDTSSSTAGVGGSGGGAPSCYSDTVLLNSLDATSCNGVNVPIESASDNCGDGYDEIVPGKDVCAMGYSVFTKGAAQVLEACLAEIPAQKPESCDQSLVDACVGEMTASACDNAGTQTLCDAINDSCAGEGSFTSAYYDGCLVQLKPFNQGALDAFLACMGDAPDDLDCAGAYDFCLDSALALPE